MGVFTSETEATSAIPPARLFKALIVDGDNIIPKVATQYIKSVEIIQGNGGPGTIKKITFGEGSPFKYMKHEVVTLDQASLTYGYTLTEGDPLSDELEKITCETKIVASPDGGSIFKSISHYHTKGNHEMKEEQVKAGNERSVGLFKAVEAYLVAHPDEYN